MTIRKGIAIALPVLLLLGVAAFYHWRTHHISLVQQGFAEAAEHGCFECHGLGGSSGVKNPGSRWKSVPEWNGGTHMMFIENEGEISEWILDGGPARLRHNKEWQAEQSKALIRMPAFRATLDEADLAAIIAYFKAVAEFEKIPVEAADAGRDEAREMGCFHCHGPEGRGCMPNPRSLKGYIPSWDGRDFTELVANDEELKEWILDGVAKRLTKNRFALFFMQRQQVQMPAYKDKISNEQLDHIMAYIQWIRGRQGKTGSAR